MEARTPAVRSDSLAHEHGVFAVVERSSPWPSRIVGSHPAHSSSRIARNLTLTCLKLSQDYARIASRRPGRNGGRPRRRCSSAHGARRASRIPRRTPGTPPRRPRSPRRAGSLSAVPPVSHGRYVPPEQGFQAVSSGRGDRPYRPLLTRSLASRLQRLRLGQMYAEPTGLHTGRPR